MSCVDTHICGACKAQFAAIEDYFVHKRNGCFSFLTTLPASLLSEYLSSVFLISSTDGDITSSQQQQQAANIGSDQSSSSSINFQQVFELQQNSFQQTADASSFIKYESSCLDEISNINMSGQLGFETLPPSESGDIGQLGHLIVEIPAMDSVVDDGLSMCLNSSSQSIGTTTTFSQSGPSDSSHSNGMLLSFSFCDVDNLKTSIERSSNINILPHINDEILEPGCASVENLFAASSNDITDKEQVNITADPAIIDGDSERLVVSEVAPVAVQRRYKCGVSNCTFSSTYKKDLCRHSRIHTGEKPFLCAYCQKTFARMDKLNLHLRCHTGVKPYKCTVCSYATTDGSSLKKHLRIHSNEKPFKCQICSYASRNADQLVIHLRSHTGDSPFECVVCKASFKSSSDLKRHVRLHTGEKPYACTLCDYRCSVKGNLTSHCRINHSQDNTMTCEVCAFQTPSRRVYKNHTQMHLAVKITHQCSSCNYSCNSLSELRVHRKTHNTCAVDGQDEGLNVTVSGAAAAAAAGRLKLVRAGRQFHCDRCEASFVRMDSLKSHIRCHQRAEMTQCTALTCDISSELSTNVFTIGCTDSLEPRAL